MESISTLLEVERNFFGGTYAYEESDFMAQLLGNFSTKSPNIPTFEDSSAFWPHHEPTMNIDKVDDLNISIPLLLSDNSYTDGDSILFPTTSGESHLLIDHSRGSEKSISFIPLLSDNTLMGDEGTAEPSTKYNNSLPNSRKRSCSLEDVPMSWKKSKLSKSQVDHDAVSRHGTNMRDSDDNSSGLEDASPRPKGVAMPSSNGKKRSSSGPATDSQSVYARKRRERINERLRILQNLVPNGTKVDISTMLEEAVQYVKFLQLQIKLLSSDELWMYAPIAYNGMNMGLDMNPPSPR